MSGRTRLLGPGLMTLVMLVTLIGLGTWQLQRLRWKEDVLARVDIAERNNPIPLPGDPQPFTKVMVEGQLRADLAAMYGAEVRETPTGPKMGAHLIVPLERDTGNTVLVDRGWVPVTPAGPLDLPAGRVHLTGFIRPAETAGWFSATDDLAARHFYTLNPAAIAAALRLPEAAPFILVALGEAPASRWPDPARHLPRPPNNHLAYVVTWYGLAGTLLVIFVIWARKGSKDA